MAIFRCWHGVESETDGFDIAIDKAEDSGAWQYTDDAVEGYAAKLCDGDSDYYKMFTSGVAVHCRRPDGVIEHHVVSVDWSPTWVSVEIKENA
jgi:hypothetical protein